MPRFVPADTHVMVRRAVAQIADSFILLWLALTIWVVDRALVGVVMLVAFFGYFGWLQGATGWTLGKLMVGIRVVDATGAPPGLMPGIKRSLPLLVHALGIVALVLMLLSPWRQRAGDRWANTYVVPRSAKTGRRARTSRHVDDHVLVLTDPYMQDEDTALRD